MPLRALIAAALKIQESLWREAAAVMALDARSVPAGRNRWALGLVAATIVMVITLIMDLGRPRRGLVRVSQQPMIDLISGL